MPQLTFHSNSEPDTERLGAALASTLPPGTVVALNGPLGAGKTRLVQAVAVALGVTGDAVTSPTFVLVNEYRGGRLPVFHFDAYRLKDSDEFAELGPEEYFEGEGICFIEWAERVQDFLPADAVDISIEVLGDTERQVAISARSDNLVSQIENALADSSRVG